MLPKSGTIFISTKLPDGTVQRNEVPIADEYLVEIKAVKTTVIPIEHTPDTEPVPAAVRPAPMSPKPIQPIAPASQGLPLEPRQPQPRPNTYQPPQGFPQRPSYPNRPNLPNRPNYPNRPNLPNSPVVQNTQPYRPNMPTRTPLPNPVQTRPPQPFRPPTPFRPPAPRPNNFGRQPMAPSVPEGFTVKPYDFGDVDIVDPYLSPPSPVPSGTGFGGAQPPFTPTPPPAPITPALPREDPAQAEKDRLEAEKERQVIAQLAEERKQAQKLEHEQDERFEEPVKTAMIPSPWNSTADQLSQAASLMNQKHAKMSGNGIGNAGLKSRFSAWRNRIGAALLSVSLIGIIMPYAGRGYMEASYQASRVSDTLGAFTLAQTPVKPTAGFDFNPLLKADGTKIVPYSTAFGLVIPKIGVNSAVTEDVDVANRKVYDEVLKNSVAHAGTSSTPDQMGTTYLFSHDTNYEWFVDDLNAVFYQLKQLEPGDTAVVFYKDVRYTYKVVEKRIVKPTAVSYLLPDTSKKSLILQTCWPPGQTTERLLVMADLVDERGVQI